MLRNFITDRIMETLVKKGICFIEYSDFFGDYMKHCRKK